MSDFEKQIHAMFDHIWDCDIDHLIFEHTVGELMDVLIQCYNSLPSAHPERKKGKWKVVPYKSVQHGEVVIDGETVRCSECRHAGKGWHLGMRFCPNCGSYNGGDENRENSHTVKEWF